MNRGLTIALVAAVAVLAIGVVGIAGYVFVVMPKSGAVAEEPAEKKEESKKPAVETSFFKMNKFVTNLADTNQLRYIDVTIALGLKGPESEKFVKSAEPQIRHVILSQIRTLKAADLAGPEGKDKLAQVIHEGLVELLADHITNVYVTDMVIQ